MTGTIRTLRVDKGFGLIKDNAGKEYSFHQSAVSGERIDDLREGDGVEFEAGQRPKGPRAETVPRTSVGQVWSPHVFGNFVNLSAVGLANGPLQPGPR